MLSSEGTRVPFHCTDICSEECGIQLASRQLFADGASQKPEVLCAGCLRAKYPAQAALAIVHHKPAETENVRADKAPPAYLSDPDLTQRIRAVYDKYAKPGSATGMKIKP